MSDLGLADPDLRPWLNEVCAGLLDRVPAAEAGQAGQSSEYLWTELDALGLTRLTGAESAGGSGAGWPEAAELLTAAAWHGLRLPIAEHDVLAGWLLETLGLPTDHSRRTVAVLDDRGEAHGVPWAAASERIVVVWGGPESRRTRDVAVADLEVRPGLNIAGEPRDHVTFVVGEDQGHPVPEAVFTELTLRGALVRAVQGCGALERILSLSVDYTTQRYQFGRPLAKFQAIQHMLADIAGEVALARSATDTAVRRVAVGPWTCREVRASVATARSCVGHATTTVVRNAHQVHGAIGTTQEHQLHRFTLAALAWRSESGTTEHWDQVLTDLLLEQGSLGLWPTIVSS